MGCGHHDLSLSGVLAYEKACAETYDLLCKSSVAKLSAAEGDSVLLNECAEGCACCNHVSEVNMLSKSTRTNQGCRRVYISVG